MLMVSNSNTAEAQLKPGSSSAVQVMRSHVTSATEAHKHKFNDEVYELQKKNFDVIRSTSCTH